jgi:hypothetical protein
MVHDEVDREIRNLAIGLGQQGVDFEQLVKYGGVDLEKMHQDSRPAAEDRVRQELVLDALAAAEGLNPTDAHIEAEAARTLADSPDRDRLLASDRVRAYVRERLRLQWALLWLAAMARGERWSPPSPQDLTAGAETAPAAAASELLEAPVLESVSVHPAEAESVPAGEEGMVDI